MPRFISIILLALLAAILPTPALAASQSWGASDLEIEMGTGVRSPGGLTLRPNEAGQVYINLPNAKISLKNNHLLELQFGDTPPPVIFIIWRNDIKPDQLFQHQLPPSRENPAKYDLEQVAGWEGTSTQVAIGLHLGPTQQAKLRQINLASPTLLSVAAGALQNWTGFQSWRPVDINLYTGTSQFGATPHPMPVFATLALLLLAGYLAWNKLKSGALHLSWRVAGGLILISWMALDTFWEARLWRQVSATYEQFAGKTPSGKLLASSDANLVRFIATVKERIPEPDARVVIASRSDGIGMRSAYYMSPLNTYWNRHGDELPPLQQLTEGDYILLMVPTAVAYREGTQQIALHDGTTLRVEPILNAPQGALLRVMGP